MLTINDLSLQDAKPTDSPHLLLWDNPNDLEIQQILFNNNAQLVSYRDNLLIRVKPQQKFLSFQDKLGQELEVLKKICTDTTKPIILLKDMDILITYLYSYPQSPLSLFWNNLANMRHLQSILWIILPSKLNPPNWNINRFQQIDH
ncbi:MULTISPECIES: hypothetical protein [Nostocales]|uniref:Uncharacterized protein n=1 Tax=Dolichospermum compactum NIES-806 TaxID=1973481 RepID=A0A1Z4V8T6_9CYAN|nr:MULTISPECIES: hypothetical protein [Nostocales]OBQ15939.1 MAG: hypothetical protein AN486_21115 [Anabaena sp. AL93]BAZ87947.1 hypothetical protein NIES806_41800 [Dolichospermum compactum NIES-806]